MLWLKRCSTGCDYQSIPLSFPLCYRGTPRDLFTSLPVGCKSNPSLKPSIARVSITYSPRVWGGGGEEMTSSQNFTSSGECLISACLGSYLANLSQKSGGREKDKRCVTSQQNSLTKKKSQASTLLLFFHPTHHRSLPYTASLAKH